MKCCWSPTALTGQDAVNLARAFDERVGLTGIVLTRVDGDGRGGAALSMRAVTNKPIKLIGTGEKMDALEEFDPARIAGRILGMGDIVALVEKAAANIDAEKAMRVAEKMRKGAFDLADMREQLMQMASMGGIGGLMGMMPGVAKMKNQIANAGIDDKMLKRQVAIIDSMTPQERRNPDLLKNSRKKRIAAGSGTTPEQINKLLKMHRGMADMMKAMGSGKRGPMAGLGQMMGFGGGGMPSPEQMAEMAKKMPGGQLPPGFPGGGGAGGLPPTMPQTAAEHSRPARLGHTRKISWAAGPARFREKEITESTSTHSNDQIVSERKLKCLSLSAWPAPAPRSARSITSSLADSRSPRDGRFIERLGYYNPLLPKDKEERLKLDLDKVKAWMVKGAQPSDRVSRFLDAAGVLKREKRNNPTKAVPRKERKALKEEALKVKEASDAAAKTAAHAKANEKAAADKAAAAAAAAK